jgi:hypothetical protein
MNIKKGISEELSESLEKEIERVDRERVRI